MKIKYYVYELINSLGTIEYVGCTYRPKNRFNEHTKNKPSPGSGKFYGREDLIMYIVKDFDNVKDARLYEGELKLSYGMEWTENTKGRKSVKVMNYVTNEVIGIYPSKKEIPRDLGLYISDIPLVLKGKLLHTNGYKIEYVTK